MNIKYHTHFITTNYRYRSIIIFFIIQLIKWSKYRTYIHIYTFVVINFYVMLNAKLCIYILYNFPIYFADRILLPHPQ